MHGLAQAHYFIFGAGHLIFYFVRDGCCAHNFEIFATSSRQGAGASGAGCRCRPVPGTFARKAKESARKCFRARNPVSQAVFMAVLHLKKASCEQTHTFLLDSEHLPPDFTVKIQNFRSVPSNKDQIKEPGHCMLTRRGV